MLKIILPKKDNKSNRKLITLFLKQSTDIITENLLKFQMHIIPRSNDIVACGFSTSNNYVTVNRRFPDTAMFTIASSDEALMPLPTMGFFLQKSIKERYLYYLLLLWSKEWKPKAKRLWMF